MMRYILGGIALVAVGYGVKKLLEDDEINDKVTEVCEAAFDKISDFEETVANGVDKFEKKFGLGAYDESQK